MPWHGETVRRHSYWPAGNASPEGHCYLFMIMMFAIKLHTHRYSVLLFEAGSCCADKAALRLRMHLSRPPQCWEAGWHHQHLACMSQLSPRSASFLFLFFLLSVSCHHHCLCDEMRSHSVAQAVWNPLCSSGWPHIHGNPRSWAAWVL